MADQLAYVLINPYTITKSRTGGVLARLMTRTALEIVTARMFAPSRQLAEEYAQISISGKDPQDRQIQELIRQYILDHYSPDPKTGQRKRVMMLVFKGDNAVKRVRDAVGSFTRAASGGESVRDTYGDYIVGPNGEVKYFEPAVLAAPTPEEAETKLKLWARYSDKDGGMLEGVVPHAPGTKIEKTLVLIKPDNFQFPSGRPGNIMDVFSRTGLYIIAVKVHQMSVAQAEEFYGPVREVLRTKLTDMVGAKARAALEEKLNLKLSTETEKPLGQLIGPYFGDNQFENIVKFMTGVAPSECDPKKKAESGTAKCLALVYEGPDAVKKIREVLGPTDPRKAPPGSIRREFGQDIMVNAAHASDSADNAKREIGIVNVAENNLKKVVESFYGSLK
jgi:nucleoside diphosphate kinase